MRKYPQYRYLGLNVVDSVGDARAFVRRYGWHWPQMRDPARVRARRLRAVWQPAVIAIDARGRIVGVDASGDRERAWERLAAQLP